MKNEPMPAQGPVDVNVRQDFKDAEQAAFEKWLRERCPSGDVESVQRQWLESYEYAELLDETKCGHCHGTGWMVRDPDIGTDQECFVCEGSGTVHNAEVKGDTK